MKKKKRSLRDLLLQTAVIAGGAAAWEIVSRIINSSDAPSFFLIADWIVRDFPLLGVSALATMSRAVVGLLFATITGMTIGIVMAMSTLADRLLSPIVNFLRPLPSSALILLFASWFGFSALPLLVVWFGCIWPILINTRDAMRTLPREIHETLDVLGVRRWNRFVKVYSRALLPDILSGIRVALSIAVILAITVELIIPPDSFLGFSNWRALSGTRDIPWALGSYLQHYYQAGDTRGIVAAVVISGLVGVFLNTVYHEIYVRILRWNKLLEE
jgi:ABC-type nitrate/sulfonate/bicarbonate transport system permease component